MKMYLDDIRNPKSDFDVIVRSSQEAISYVKENSCPEFISFDHDLGETDTSMIFVKWLVEEDLSNEGDVIPSNFSFNVHSANPVGSANITSYLNSYLRSKINF